MIRSTLFALAALVACCSPASAHFIWADIQPAAKGGSEAKFYFGETPEPGEAHLIGKIAHTKAWVRDASGEVTELKVTAPKDDKADALSVACSPSKAGSLEASCDYGVYQHGPGVLLQYYAKHLSGDWQANLAKLGRAEKLPLDIVPDVAVDKLNFKVLFNGKPAADCELVVLDPAGKSEELKTDAEGKASTTVKAGRYAVRAGHRLADKSGERDGKKYAQTWHYCTLTMELPADKVAASASSEADEIPAGKLLTRAREGRAIWKGFPGFSADLVATSQGEQTSGKVTIDNSGVVDYQGTDSPLKSWIEEQLSSLVQHRLPDGEVSEGKITYPDKDLTHPMGRKIDLGDPKLQSAYRIKDDVIMEVNRSMGKMRFTISVLEIERNKEGKYLPRSFTMNFFDSATSQLRASHSYLNTWQRVGAYDLPDTILEIGTEATGAVTKQIQFKNCKLVEEK